MQKQLQNPFVFYTNILTGLVDDNLLEFLEDFVFPKLSSLGDNYTCNSCTKSSTVIYVLK